MSDGPGNPPAHEWYDDTRLASKARIWRCAWCDIEVREPRTECIEGSEDSEGER